MKKPKELKSIVSIRVPKSLVEEFRDISNKNHFLDLSDALRTIIRQKMIEQKDPYLLHIRKLREEIKGQVQKDVFGKERLIEELEKIKNELLEGQL